MAATLSKLFFLVHFLFAHFSRTEYCLRESRGSTLYNRVLVGRTYKSLMTRGILSCGHKCLADPLCASYNYQTSAIKDGVCELNENSIEGREIFQERHGFVFVRMIGKTKPKSCLEAWKQGARSSGFYVIQGRTECLWYDMYCDFSSEPGWAWTLVMSQGFGRKGDTFAKISLLEGTFVNHRTPNWEKYRIGGTRMKIVAEQSSHWRVTCDFPTFGVDYRDYVRATFENLDPRKYSASGECRVMEHINIRGHNCSQCTSAWWQTRDQPLTHFSDLDTCQFGITQGSLHNEANFGGYWNNSFSLKFRCSSSDTSSTNHWFGGKV